MKIYLSVTRLYRNIFGRPIFLENTQTHTKKYQFFIIKISITRLLMHRNKSQSIAEAYMHTNQIKSKKLFYLFFRKYGPVS